MSSLDKHVGLRLRRQRLAKGLSQGELGISLGISDEEVDRIERGEMRLGAELMTRACAALDVNVPYFFVGVASDIPATRTDDHPPKTSLH